MAILTDRTACDMAILTDRTARLADSVTYAWGP
jgi:hypothetical protein